jgi:hypothetical protein
MNTVKKQSTRQNGFSVIKCQKKVNKRLDRLVGALLVLVSVAITLIEKDLTAPIIITAMAIPLIFGKKRYVEI